MLAVFFTTVLFWFTEAIPLPVTALIVPILIALFGLLPAGEVFSAFGSDILFLFLGCFFLGQSMAKHGFDRRVAYWLLGRCLKSDSLLGVNVVIAAASFFLSMWISNTAAAAIMSAITLGILDSLKTKISDEQILRAASVRLLLSCAFAASIGGLATPIGSPPNLIALRYLAIEGIEISFLEWMIFGLPISIIMLAILFVVFELRYPIRGIKVDRAREHFAAALGSLGKMNTGEKQTAAVFLITVAFWILPEAATRIFPEIKTLKMASDRLSMSVIGLLGGISLFLMPLRRSSGEWTANLEWAEAKAVDWGTILLFGGGLALGNLLEQSGAANDLGQFLFRGGLANLQLLVAIVIVVSILLSEFASNTASAAVLIPLIVGTAESADASTSVIRGLVLCVAFSASFGFMLPVSTPPNAIVYGTGRIHARDMRITGMWFDISGALVIAGFVALMVLLNRT